MGGLNGLPFRVPGSTRRLRAAARHPQAELRRATFAEGPRCGISSGLFRSYPSDAETSVLEAELPPEAVPPLTTSEGHELLDEVEFVEEPATSATGKEPVEVRPPGPGLPESILWAVAVAVLQIVGGVGAMIVLLLPHVLKGGGEMPDAQEVFESLTSNAMLLFIGVPNTLVFGVLILAGLLRLGQGRVRKLNLALPSLTQAVILMSAVIPLGIIADALFHAADRVWQELVKLLPVELQWINDTNVMETMEDLQDAWLPALVFVVAVVPALGEEFVLRGLIGRGLVARWGVPAGMLMTSGLFAALHMYPPHVAATFAIGMMLHFAYLSTRSFWAPVVFHFVNNVLAILATRAEDTGPGSVWTLAMACAWVVISAACLWGYRTRYVRDDGSTAHPAYPTVEAPPPDVGARRYAPSSLIACGVFAAALAGQSVWMAGELTTAPAEQPQSFDASAEAAPAATAEN
jgi:membrane protease YdiL (CAAX protease family)